MLKEKVRLFKVFSSPYRLAAINELKLNGECRIGKLAEENMIGVATMGYHMRPLVNLGIVREEGHKKIKKFVFNEEKYNEIVKKITDYLTENI